MTPGEGLVTCPRSSRDRTRRRHQHVAEARRRRTKCRRQSRKGRCGRRTRRGCRIRRSRLQVACPAVVMPSSAFLSPAICRPGQSLVHIVYSLTALRLYNCPARKLFNSLRHVCAKLLPEESLPSNAATTSNRSLDEHMRRISSAPARSRIGVSGCICCRRQLGFV